jgi:hypothetical protein
VELRANCALKEAQTQEHQRQALPQKLSHNKAQNNLAKKTFVPYVPYCG